jgi:hypothetical protein
MAGNLESRWIVLSVDGRHVTLGRHTDPSPDEIAEAEKGLSRQGTAGWLAVMRGQYHGRGKLELMRVRALADPAIPWEQAVTAFEALRAETLVAS